MAFTVTSNSFKDGDYLSKDHILSVDFGFGCAGGNRSPHLAWRGAPAGTKSFAITCYDPDAPTGSGLMREAGADLSAGLMVIAGEPDPVCACNAATAPRDRAANNITLRASKG